MDTLTWIIGAMKRFQKLTAQGEIWNTWNVGFNIRIAWLCVTPWARGSFPEIPVMDFPYSPSLAHCFLPVSPRLMVSVETVPDPDVNRHLALFRGASSLHSRVKDFAPASSLSGKAPFSLRRGSFPGGSRPFTQMDPWEATPARVITALSWRIRQHIEVWGV